MDDELDFDRWASAVGKIVMSLSRVEGELLMKYETSLSKNRYFKDSFWQRLSKIRELYNTECGENSVADSLFEKILKATEYRNLVAHNPIYADISGGLLKFEISTQKKDDISIDLVFLEKEAKRICLLCTEFSVLLRGWGRI